MNRLEGKVAIVTGATGGIGQASARRFVAEGAKVAVAARNMDRAKTLADELGANAFAVRYELSEDASIEAAIAETVDRFGRLDILFNNAAGTDTSAHGPDTTVTEVTDAAWEAAFALNVRSVMVGCRHAIPHILKSGGGAIINTASGSGLRGDNVRVAYGSSKAALIAFTQYLAVQYGHKGIRANAIAPGLIVIDKVKDNQFLKDLISPHVLTPRLGEPEDIAALAAFLAADESGYITGQVICCDGGMLIHQPQYSHMMAMQAGK